MSVKEGRRKDIPTNLNPSKYSNPPKWMIQLTKETRYDYGQYQTMLHTAGDRKKDKGKRKPDCRHSYNNKYTSHPTTQWYVPYSQKKHPKQIIPPRRTKSRNTTRCVKRSSPLPNKIPNHNPISNTNRRENNPNNRPFQIADLLMNRDHTHHTHQCKE